MIIGIDALNIRAGGGLKHLQELFLSDNGFTGLGVTQVVVFISSGTKLQTSNPLIKLMTIPRKSNPIINYWYQKKVFKQYCEACLCDILFCPGGSYPGLRIPYVSMSQNMLVFEKKERNRFPLGLTRLRYIILEIIQSKSMRKSVGNIFISNYAKDYIFKLYPSIAKINHRIIHLGASGKFEASPKRQQPIASYSWDAPLKLTYISIINYYKHQYSVIQAVQMLRDKGYPVELLLVGEVLPSLKAAFKEWLVGKEDYVKYKGKVPYEQIELVYQETDIFVFASSCENMPNIVVEAMSSGLPIACSSYGPMPEILKDAGVYFDPTEPISIAESIEVLLRSAEKREELATRAHQYAKEYTWQKCTYETYKFLSETANQSLPQSKGTKNIYNLI